MMETVRRSVSKEFAHLTPQELTEKGVERAGKSVAKDEATFFLRAACIQSEQYDTETQNICNANLGAWLIASRNLGKMETGIDLLKKTAKSTTSDELKAKIYLKLAAAFEYKQEFFHAICYYKKFIRCPQTASTPPPPPPSSSQMPVVDRKKADARFRLGICYKKMNNWPAALKAFRSAAKQYHDHRVSFKHAQCLLQQAEVRFRIGQITEKCVELGQDCLHTLRKIKTPSVGLAILYHDVGIIFVRCNLHARAVPSFSTAYDKLKMCPTRTPQQEAVILQNLGAVLTMLREFKQAENILGEAIQLNTNISRQAQGECYFNLGTVLYQQKKYQRAQYMLLQAVQAARETGDTKLCRQSYELIADIMRTKDKGAEAKMYLKGAILVDSSAPTQLERKRYWDIFWTTNPTGLPQLTSSGNGRNSPTPSQSPSATSVFSRFSMGQSLNNSASLRKTRPATQPSAFPNMTHDSHAVKAEMIRHLDRGTPGRHNKGGVSQNDDDDSDSDYMDDDSDDDNGSDSASLSSTHESERTLQDAGETEDTVNRHRANGKKPISPSTKKNRDPDKDRDDASRKERKTKPGRKPTDEATD